MTPEDVEAALAEAGTRRGAAELLGTTPETVNFLVNRHGLDAPDIRPDDVREGVDP